MWQKFCEIIQDLPKTEEKVICPQDSYFQEN